MSSPIVDNRRSRNINVWKDAEVYISHDVGAQVGADGTFDPEVWRYFGLLNTGTEIGQEFEINRNDVQAFGGELQLKDSRFVRDTRTVTALESNEVTHSILWPGSKWVEEGASVLIAPENAAEVIVAFKTVNSFGDTLIEISRTWAFAYSSGSAKGDEGASTTEFTFEIPRDDEGALYDSLKIKGDGTTETADLAPIRIFGQSSLIVSGSVPDGTVGEAYSGAISTTGGVEPYTAEVTSGALPDGVTLAGDGTLSGSPTAAGEFTFNVTAMDADGQTGSQSFTVTIAA